MVRCSETVSSLLWQSAVLVYARPGRDETIVWIKMFHLLKTLSDHIYFGVLCYCHFCCRIREETTFILEMSKGESLVKFFIEALAVS